MGFSLYRYGAEDIPNVLLDLTVLLCGTVGLDSPKSGICFPNANHIGEITGGVGEIADAVFFLQATAYIIGLHKQICVFLKIKIQSVCSKKGFFLSVNVECDRIFAENKG